VAPAEQTADDLPDLRDDAVDGLPDLVDGAGDWW
jgi:hypothetical protein